MEPSTSDSNYVNPKEFLSKEEGKYPTPAGYDDVSIYGPITQFEVSAGSNRGGKLKTLNEKLDKGWYFLFKCFVFLIALLDLVGMVLETVSIFKETISHLFSHIVIILLLAFEAYHLIIELKAIHYRDRQRAEKAVRLIQYFMFLTGVAIAGMVPIIVSEMDPIQKEQVTVPLEIAVIIGALIVAEAIIYYGFLYGAKKVRDLLREIHLLQGSKLIPA